MAFASSKITIFNRKAVPVLPSGSDVFDRLIAGAPESSDSELLRFRAFTKEGRHTRIQGAIAGEMTFSSHR